MMDVSLTGIQSSLISHWRSCNIRLKLIWTCFGLFLSLQVLAKSVCLVWPDGCLGGLAFVFIMCVIVGLLSGLHMCERDDTKICKGDKLMNWTEPLTSGIQDIHIQSQISDENVRAEHRVPVPDEVCHVGKELDHFVELIMRDFIHIWYKEYIDGDDMFPLDIANLLTCTFSEILSRLRSVDPEVLLDAALKEIHRHLTIMEKSKNNLRRLNRRSGMLDLNSANLVACYETFSVMHSAAMSEDLELDYLRSALGMVFDCILPQAIKVCEPGVLLVREIISQTVLQKGIDLISDPDFINDAIVLLAAFVEFEVSQSKSSSVSNSDKSSSVASGVVSLSVEPMPNGPSSASGGEIPLKLDSYSNKIKVQEEPMDNFHGSQDVLNQPSAKPEVNDSKESPVIVCSQMAETFPCSVNVTRRQSCPFSKVDTSVEEGFDIPQSDDVSHAEYDQTTMQRSELNFGAEGYSEACATEEHACSSEVCPSGTFKPDFPKAATMSCLSDSMPFPRPRRNKSPTFSTLSKSVDSIVDLEATPDELVSERKAHRGHTRNSSFPSFTPDVDSEDGHVPPDLSERWEDCDQLEGQGGIEQGEEEFISNLVISSTEQMQEKYSKKTFVLYVVEFNILTTKDEGRDGIQLTLVTHRTKRRYREFLTLHWKLERHAEFKKFVKGIKDAPKRFALPIMKKDVAGIEQRRVSLEKYLKQLLNISKIQTSQEMAAFLALNGDTDIAFVRDSTSYAPKFDKILRNSFSGMKQGLKNLAPFPSSKSDQKLDKSKTNVQPNPPGSGEDEEITSPYIFRICAVEPEESESVLLGRMPYVIQEALAGLELAVEALQNTSDLVQSNTVRRILKDSPSRENGPNQGPGNTGPAASSPGFVLFPRVMDIVGVLQKDHAHWMFEENVQLLLRNLAGDFMERYLKREVETLLSSNSWAVYLALIREAVWPEGTLFQPSGEALSPEEKQELYKKAEGILLDAYPGILDVIVGSDNVTSAISRLLESLQNQQLNKHLIYTFIDLVLEQALPEFRGSRAQRTTGLSF